MLVGRTFSYSDTQRYRVGPNYLQLPVNQPEVPVRTNQRDGQMAYSVDGDGGGNPHINFEPSKFGLPEAEGGKPHEPLYPESRLVRAAIERKNEYGQAGDRYRTMPDWEREDLVLNLTTLLGECDEDIQDRMIEHFGKCDPQFGERVAEGLGRPVPAGVA